nr:S-layer homology domain-containing protein [Sedimentibacter sp.]
MKTKKVIAIILCLVMAVGNFSTVFADTTVANDFEGHWAQATIQKWVDEGRISGYTDGSFKPNANITRAEFVKLVNGLIDYDTKGNISFNDVKTGDWFYDAVSIANEIGYISGYPDKSFRPNDNITREQAAAILSRIQYLGENTDVAKDFSDNEKISSWALGTVGAAAEAGFISGYENGSFKPLNNLTRAEAVTMLDNVLMNAKNKVITKAGTELSNFVVEGDLIIAKTVGEGDVHLDNVTVTGSLYVYGGGTNSLYFNNLKVNKIIVDKEKVRLVFGEGSVVEEIAVGSETILQNDDGTISKITITSDNKVTLSGSFDTVTVTGKANIVLKDAKIQNLVAEKAINILGTGTIATLTANADGVQYDSTLKITKTVVGEGVTKKPSTIPSGGGGGGGTGGGGGNNTPKDYQIQVSIEYYDGLATHKLPINTGKYSNSSIISDFMVSEIDEILGSENTTIDKYLGLAENRLKGIKIGETSLYNLDGSLNDIAWDKAFNSLEKTSLEFKDTLKAKKDSLKSDLNDGLDTTDLEKILDLYDVYKSGGTLNKDLLQKDLDEITAKLAANADKITYNGQGTFEVKCEGGTYNGGTITEQDKAVEFIVENIAFSTKTVDEFFNEFGIITIEAKYGDKTSTITIKKVAL